jgi:hypothetical protein
MMQKKKPKAAPKKKSETITYQLKALKKAFSKQTEVLEEVEFELQRLSQLISTMSEYKRSKFELDFGPSIDPTHDPDLKEHLTKALNQVGVNDRLR